MTIEAKKLSIMQEPLRVDDVKVIDAVENLLKKSRMKYDEENLKPMTISQLNKEIDMALADVKENKMVDANELKQKIQEWN